MAYRLKCIHYKNERFNILLQNENGPCPLLAAANVLLLKKSIALPSNCIGSGVVTIEELTNILAEKMLTNNHGENGSDHHINETLRIFPNLQFGMDVNPKFTSGPTGVEYTLELNAFDLLRINLVHGWLLEPEAQEFEWVGNNTYNQLQNLIIVGNDASARLREIDDNCDNSEELSNQATRGAIISAFLERSSHQLTQHGLFVLHEFVREGDMVVFFRNNHFNALTKHQDNLYLLVTDEGYADVNSVVWEKLDVIDGDTEYVNADFTVPPPINNHVSEVETGGQISTKNAQSQADYQLALQLSRECGQVSSATAVNSLESTSSHKDQSNVDKTIRASLSDHKNQRSEKVVATMASASQLQSSENIFGPTSGSSADEMLQEQSDMLLALELQRQEELQQARLRQQHNRRMQNQRTKAASKDSNCTIS